MTTIKSYTDITQSDTLSKILRLESADMLFQFGEAKYADSIRVPLTKEHWEQMMPYINPCWSLSAMISVLPFYIIADNQKYVFSILKGLDKNGETYAIKYISVNTDFYFYLTDSYNNLADACYEMVLVLNELKML